MLYKYTAFPHAANASTKLPRMTDHVDQRTRSAIMAAVGSKDTGPELKLRKMLHALGYRYRLHDSRLPGKPDIVFARRRVTVFVNGCFWHRHEGCRYATTPKTETDFWQSKFDANKARDARNIKALKRLGWRVAVVWQCQLKSPKATLSRVVKFLERK